jgi:glutathione S-transferase
MIVVHHLEHSRSQRILWLLEELQVPYSIQHYKRDAKTRLGPPELKTIHPLGKSPVITDDGRTIAESGAIVEYIIRRYGQGRLQPDTSSSAYDDYVEWLHYSEGSAMPPLLQKLIVSHVLGNAAAPLMPRLQSEIANHLGFIEASLTDRDYLLGDGLTGADIQMSFVGELAVGRGEGAGYPRIQAWVQRFQARPAYQKALTRGGQYNYFIAPR